MREGRDPFSHTHWLAIRPRVSMMADREVSPNICGILREREIYGKPITQTTLRKLDLDSLDERLALLHVLDDVNSRLADKVLAEYKEKLTTTGVTRDEIIEMEQVERVHRQFLPWRFQAMGNWMDFFQKLVSLADRRLRGERLDSPLTANCPIGCQRSVQSILKSQRFYWLARTYTRASSDGDESDDDDSNEWWCRQLIKLFEQHQYDI